METEGNETTRMRRKGEKTTTMENGESQRELSSQQEECSYELYGPSMERMASGRTTQAPPGIDVKEHSEQEILKQSGTGWKLIIAAILIIGLAVACGWLALELRKEKQKHEQDLHECAIEKERYEEKWTKEKNNYEQKFKAASLAQTEELLERKRKLKEVEDKYLEKETNLTRQLEMERKIENQLISTLNEVLISKGNRHEIVLKLASIAVSSGYAHGLQKINDALSKDLSISDIQVLDLIQIAFSSNQKSLVKTLLELSIRRKEEFITEETEIKRNSHKEYFRCVKSALLKASNIIIDIGDPEIAKVFYGNYAPHIVKLERSGNSFNYAHSIFGNATNKALNEKKFEIAKSVKTCEIQFKKIDVIIKPPGYDRTLKRATYQQLKRVVKEKELDMAIFYLEVVSKEEKDEFLKSLKHDFDLVTDFLPDRYYSEN